MISSQLLLPLYITTIILILLITMFIVDKQTPITIFIIFIVLYTALILYIWRQHRNNKSNVKIPSLSDLKNQKKNTGILSNFQAQAQKILREINMQKSSNTQQQNYYSSYTNYYSPMTLSEISSQSNDYPQQSNIFGTYNTQTWRQQFRLASQQFILNLSTPQPVTHTDIYKSLLQKLNIKQQSIQQCEQIVTNLLKDRLIQYTHTAMNVVNQINKILTRNFGLNLTKVQSTNSKEIGIQQFMKLVNYYNVNKILPSNYRNLAINYPGYQQNPINNNNMGSLSYQTSSSLPSYSSYSSYSSLNRTSNNNNNSNKLDSDMRQLTKLLYFIQPISYHPTDQFNPTMLLYILRQQFANQNIYVNRDANNRNNLDNQLQNQQNLFSMGMGRTKNNYSFIVQIDYWISLNGFSEFRTKNCMKICLIFLLVLLRNQSNYGHPVLRALRKLQK